ncbi:hypothetical protein G4G28_16545 [Massilia sp. Dwa41.01b]|uniref:hypothetical protein n=1 Tax=Massilia sp. Dwa41.01b TaxID=2709302 RepID=UPI001600B842|nr:hypothetical protein [Massilia sp. Dwa41.01b]QNA89679.1 hypothetical protein G4G28_16545 [Massilia sp. Dwa41.01b]
MPDQGIAIVLVLFHISEDQVGRLLGATGVRQRPHALAEGLVELFVGQAELSCEVTLVFGLAVDRVRRHMKQREQDREQAGDDPGFHDILVD